MVSFRRVVSLYVPLLLTIVAASNAFLVPNTNAGPILLDQGRLPAANAVMEAPVVAFPPVKGGGNGVLGRAGVGCPAHVK